MEVSNFKQNFGRKAVRERKGYSILCNLLIAKLSPWIRPCYRMLHPLSSKPTLDFVGLGMCMTKCFHTNITSWTKLGPVAALGLLPWVLLQHLRLERIKIAVRWSYRRNPHPLACRTYTKPLPTSALRQVHIWLRDGMAPPMPTICRAYHRVHKSQSLGPNLRFYLVFVSHCRRISGYYFEIGHDHLLSNPCLLTNHHNIYSLPHLLCSIFSWNKVVKKTIINQNSCIIPWMKYKNSIFPLKPKLIYVILKN